MRIAPSLCAAVAALLVAAAQGAAAADRGGCASAVLRVVAGDVGVLTAQGVPVQAAAGLALCPGDRVIVRTTRLPTPVAVSASTAGVVTAQAAIWFPAAQKLVRVGENTQVAIPPEPNPARLTLLQGIVYVISAVRRAFVVETDLVAAGIDGTEATVHRLAGAGAVVAVREGQVTAEDGARSLILPAGGVAFAPDSGGLREVGPGDAADLPAPFRGYVASPTGAADWAVHFPPGVLAAGAEEPALSQAARLIADRRLAEAETALDCATAPGAADPRGALCAMLAVALDRRAGRGGAGVAVEDFAAAPPPPDAPAAAQIAQSYVAQSLGRLKDARDFADAAVRAAPEDLAAQARLAEVDLLLGDPGAAIARLAPLAGPGCAALAQADAVLGFALLSALRLNEARARLDCAVRGAPADPLGWTGRGLLAIREGRLAAGRDDLETAVALDPRRAATRAWLGRALLDEGRAERSRKEFALAIEEDPDDPAPRLFAALERFAANDPLAALRLVEEAEARGAARATLRSGAGLAEDAAVRGAALGRIFDLLGLGVLARAAGGRGADRDPANPEAHRFLADALRAQGGSEIASASSLLRADLLSPPGRAPLQAELGETNLGLLQTSGPTRLTFAEFAPAFDADGASVWASGLLGTQETFGGEVALSALSGPVSLALSAARFGDDGYRDNNEADTGLLAAQARWRPDPAFGVFLEARHRDTEAGDRRLGFDIDAFSPNAALEIERSVGRLGFRADPAPGHTVIGVGSVGRLETRASNAGLFTTSDEVTREGWDLQLQHIGRFGPLTTVAGASRIALEDEDLSRTVLDDPFFGFAVEDRATADLDLTNVYAYGRLEAPAGVEWTAGFSWDDVDRAGGGGEADGLHPKLGVTAGFGPVSLRAAYVESVGREALFAQTIEPATVAGFPQFIDSVFGAEFRRIGLGADLRAGPDVWLGVEATFDRIEVPFDGEARTTEDDAVRAYVAWAATDRLILGAEYLRERGDSTFPFDSRRHELDSATLSARWFDPSGLFVGGEASFVSHEADVFDSDTGDDGGSDEFLMVNAFAGWRLPEQRGVATLEVRNLFDQDVSYRDRSYREDLLAAPRYARDLTVVARVTLRF